MTAAIPPRIDAPAADEYAPFYATYVARVDGGDAWPALAGQAAVLRRLFSSLDPARLGFRYAEGKWTPRQVLAHLIDGERIFGLRAYCFAHGDAGPLPGFDESAYAAIAGADAVPIDRLIDEFESTRRANLLFFGRLEPAAFARRGVANGKSFSVRALAWVMAGHPRHHLAVLRERYGIAVPD